MRKIENAQEIFNCLKLFDASAPRRISERVECLEEYAQKLIINANNFCVEEDGEIIGFISFYINHSEIAYIAVIAVSECFKRCGIGTSLLKKAIDVSKNQGLKQIMLEVDSQNKAAISFYQSNNFYKDTSKDINSKKQSIYMTKELG